MRSESGATIVIEGREQGSVFPRTREDLVRDVIVDGRTTEFDIRGALFSKKLSIAGPGTVRGPVLAGEDLSLEVGAPGRQRFLSGMSARGSIVTKPLGMTGIHDTPAVSVDGVRFVFRGDVTATHRVHLRNALVVGSVVAPHVQLDHCIVLGTVTARDTPGLFHASSSAFGAYDARRVVIEGPSTIIVAAGASDEEPVLQPHKAGGAEFPVAMRYLSLCRREGIGCGMPESALTQLRPGYEAPKHNPFPGICCEYWLNQSCAFKDAVGLYKTDFIRVPVSLRKRPASVPQGATVEEKTERWFFGPQGRALHLEKIKEREKFFDGLLHRIFACEHLESEDRNRLIEDIKGEQVSQQETVLFDLVTKGLEGSN